MYHIGYSRIYFLINCVIKHIAELKDRNQNSIKIEIQ